MSITRMSTTRRNRHNITPVAYIALAMIIPTYSNHCAVRFKPDGMRISRVRRHMNITSRDRYYIMPIVYIALALSIITRGHHRPGPGEPHGPGLVRLDQGHALGQRRPPEPVGLDREQGVLDRIDVRPASQARVLGLKRGPLHKRSAGAFPERGIDKVMAVESVISDPEPQPIAPEPAAVAEMVTSEPEVQVAASQAERRQGQSPARHGARRGARPR